MLKSKIYLILLFLFLTVVNLAQVSINDIRNAGIKSEEDLKKLGVSDEEIQKIKTEIFGGVSNKPSTNKTGEVKPLEEEGPVKNELPVSQPIKEETQKTESLSIYGQKIFKSGYFSIKQNSDRILAAPNYTLGTGDRISVTIWGSSEFSDEFTLDEYGNITPTLVGRINLKGKTFSQAQQIIKSRFGRVYNLTSSKIAINLSYSKVISVNIVGEVIKPGTYNIPSVNSAFNLVSLAGGITKLGSVRSIEIRRQGKLVSELDLYHFLNAPDKFSNQYLQDGDFIVVKPYFGTISLRGEIKRPGLYEVKPKESLVDLIDVAGGFQTFADKEAVNIIRIEDNQLMFHTYNYEIIQSTEFSVRSGDIVSVLKIPELVNGMVEIRGAVNVPGEYKYQSGMKVSDLLKLANGTNRTSYLKHAQIIRTNKDLIQEIIKLDLEEIIQNPGSKSNLLLQEFDLVKVFNSENLKQKYSVYAKGALNKSGETEFYEKMSLEDLILEFDGLRKEADYNNIQIERVVYSKNDSLTSYVRLIKLSYPKDSNFKLSANDIVHFRILPQFQKQQTIKIIGEVKYPGEYSLCGGGDKLSDLIERAGGLTEWASLKGTQLNREQNNLGLILMDLEEALNKKDSKYNYILKEGDVISIPRVSNLVSISGAIGYHNENENLVSSPFHQNRRAGFYVKKYGGGYATKAQRRRVYVVSENGMIKDSRLFGWIKPRVEAGDKIVVNYKKPKQKREKGDPIDWNRVIENTTIKLTGVLTLLILADRAFTN